MGCSHYITIQEPNQSKNIVEQEVKEESPISFYGFSKEEVETVQSLLSKNKYGPNEVIGYKAEIEFDAANSYYTEYLIVQTAKEDGKKYSGKYKFKSNIARGQYMNLHAFLNKTQIDSKKAKANKYDYLEIEMDYNLNENDSSIITISVMTDIRTELILTAYEVYFVVIYFSSYDKSFFKLNIKWSEQFYFSNTRKEIKNKLEFISKQELILSGTEYLADSFHFRYDYGQRGYELDNNMKYFNNCDAEELLSLQIAANSVGLIYQDVNIFGIKDIFDISSTRECGAKTFIYLIYPTERNTYSSANFFFELEQNSIELIQSKINNEENDRCKVQNLGKFDIINVYFGLKNEQFCVVELDYTFELKDIRDTNPNFGYNLCVNHKNLLIGGFYSCEIKMEHQNMIEIKSNGLFIDTIDEKDYTMKLKYKGFKTTNPLVMLNLPDGK